jgi:hypothetical protein
MRRILSCFIGVLAGLTVATPASAETNSCVGTEFGTPLQAGVYTGLTITGGPSTFCYVPSGASVTIRGNVTIEPDSWLDARDGQLTVTGKVYVGSQGNFVAFGGDDVFRGSLVADGATAVILGDVMMYGSLRATGPSGQLDLFRSTVRGSVSVIGVTPSPIANSQMMIFGNQISGSVRLLDNSNPATVADNRIFGSLSCWGNVPAPVVEAGLGLNEVTGNKSGQCTAL